jgi:hypothetical protein
MRYTPDTFQSVHTHYFARVTTLLLRIHESGASGRLSLRNEKRFGIVHLYFREALLVHVAGDKQGGGAIVLRDMLTWTQAQVRFDWNVIGKHQFISWQEAEIFSRWLSLLEIRALDCGVSPILVEGLEDRLSAHLLRQTAPLPAVTIPLPVQQLISSRSSARWPALRRPSATPQPTMPSLTSLDRNGLQKLQRLPATPLCSDMQEAQKSDSNSIETTREKHAASIRLSQVTGVMQAVGRAVTRKMTSIKLPHRS